MGNEQAGLPKKSVLFNWGAATDKGRSRETNEDAFAVDAEAGLFLVSDGMGGHRGGELASNIVAEDLPVMIETGLVKLRSYSTRAIRSFLKKIVAMQSRHVKLEGTSETGFEDMGSTVALLLVADDRAYVANAGDSRVYKYRNGKLAQVSKDQSVVSELLDKGKIDQEQAENHPALGEITHYIGMEEKIKPFVRSFALQKDDRLLLCSDGLTDMIEDKDIERVIREQGDPQAACDELVKKANAAGGYDNITLIIVDITRQTSP